MKPKTDKKSETLVELVETIRKERKSVGRKPFSHNIISLCLSQIAERYGYQAANQVIDDESLEALGWFKEDLI